jgi:hypothetical protein
MDKTTNQTTKARKAKVMDTENVPTVTNQDIKWRNDSQNSQL